MHPAQTTRLASLLRILLTIGVVTFAIGAKRFARV